MSHESDLHGGGDEEQEGADDADSEAGLVQEASSALRDAVRDLIVEATGGPLSWGSAQRRTYDSRARMSTIARLWREREESVTKKVVGVTIFRFDNLQERPRQ